MFVWKIEDMENMEIEMNRPDGWLIVLCVFYFECFPSMIATPAIWRRVGEGHNHFRLVPNVQTRYYVYVVCMHASHMWLLDGWMAAPAHGLENKAMGISGAVNVLVHFVADNRRSDVMCV